MGFFATNPATGAPLPGEFAEAGPADVAAACARAEAAAQSYRDRPLPDRARFLDTIAERIEAARDPIIARATAETGLPIPRLEGETARTAAQLRLFARLVRDGAFLDLRLDPAQPDRKPIPRPDLRLRNIPLGPVAVFGASNFPLAFSVAGGDTASALAAGCPVIVKNHPAHPGTGELVAGAILEAITECDMPPGVFSLLTGSGQALGQSLVTDPRIAAVGFTGSRRGGLALLRFAASRPVPIPVYAEMSSVNPVFLLPGALQSRAEPLATSFIASLTLGAGQFCTNPGLLFAHPGPALDSFLAAAAAALRETTPAPMLTPQIHTAYTDALHALETTQGVHPIAASRDPQSPHAARAALFTTDAARFAAEPTLAHEIFGATALLVTCDDDQTMRDAAARLEGQLTATLHLDPASPDDIAAARRLLPTLEARAGRILVNGWPTGVEVGHAMVHGGPYPATSDPRTTSVGARAIERFLRPVCYQDFPEQLLPTELTDANPDDLPRQTEGRRGAAPSPR